MYAISSTNIEVFGMKVTEGSTTTMSYTDHEIIVSLNTNSTVNTTNSTASNSTANETTPLSFSSNISLFIRVNYT